MKYEYRVIQGTFLAEDLPNKMNELGQAGYKVSQILPAANVKFASTDTIEVLGFIVIMERDEH